MFLSDNLFYIYYPFIKNFNNSLFKTNFQKFSKIMHADLFKLMMQQI